HAPDHIMSSVIGPSITVPVEDGLLRMGNYQRIVFVEFNGPRNRDVMFNFISENG
ncbi:YjbQ family protein, partial [Patescibacteria group bacterium]|nr:YjbQ family protein [Patescibacteria group bacterium]